MPGTVHRVRRGAAPAGPGARDAGDLPPRGVGHLGGRGRRGHRVPGVALGPRRPARGDGPAADPGPHPPPAATRRAAAGPARAPCSSCSSSGEAWAQFIGGGARPAVPAAYDDAVSAHAAARPAARVAGSERLRHDPGRRCADGHAAWMRCRSRLAGLAERSESLAVRPKVVGLLDELHEAGLGPLVEDLATRTVAAGAGGGRARPRLVGVRARADRDARPGVRGPGR